MKTFTLIFVLCLPFVSLGADIRLQSPSASPTPPPAKVLIEHTGKADPEKNCQAAIQGGDWRFRMIGPYSGMDRFDYPGVPEYDARFVKEKGAKLVEAKADGEVSDSLAAFRYAYRYNRYLLTKIPGSDQPPPGYGTEALPIKTGFGETVDLARGRNLKRYAYGGRIGWSSVASKAERKASASRFQQARDLVWRHWREKKRAYIVVTISGKDYGVTRYLFTEPNAEGIWQITGSEVRSSMRGPKIADLPAITSVAKVKPSFSDEPQGSYVLSFCMADGSEVARL